MRFALLGSGSRGNALLVEAGETRLLLDCGFNLKEMEWRLARLGVAPEGLKGVLLTHEHSDHAHGAFRFARRHGLAVWLTHGTHAALQSRATPAQVHFVDSHAAFGIGDIHITPYPVPHDAREPVQYVFSDGARRLGVLTDAGRATQHMVPMLQGCAALVLECNHDP
jgi:phosphoribosyl 1,2-cyclic phosphodiesterase